MNELELLYADPRVRAVLGVIRDAEGTSKYQDAYRVGGGGAITLQDLSTPQFNRWGFTEKTGKKNVSTATGAYQFLRGTWGGLQQRYGLRDFSPRSQDLAAIALLKESGAIPYILKGDYFGGLNKAKRIWASLPGAGYNQQERSVDFLRKSLEKHLGQPLNMHEQSMYAQQPQQPQQQVDYGQVELTPNLPNDPFADIFKVNEDKNAYNEPEQQQQVAISSWSAEPNKPWVNNDGTLNLYNW